MLAKNKCTIAYGFATDYCLVIFSSTSPLAYYDSPLHPLQSRSDNTIVRSTLALVSCIYPAP